MSFGSGIPSSIELSHTMKKAKFQESILATKKKRSGNYNSTPSATKTTGKAAMATMNQGIQKSVGLTGDTTPKTTTDEIKQSPKEQQNKDKVSVD